MLPRWKCLVAVVVLRHRATFLSLSTCIDHRTNIGREFLLFLLSEETVFLVIVGSFRLFLWSLTSEPSPEALPVTLTG